MGSGQSELTIWKVLFELMKNGVSQFRAIAWKPVLRLVSNLYPLADMTDHVRPSALGHDLKFPHGRISCRSLTGQAVATYGMGCRSFPAVRRSVPTVSVLDLAHWLSPNFSSSWHSDVFWSCGFDHIETSHAFHQACHRSGCSGSRCRSFPAVTALVPDQGSSPIPGWR